MDLTEKIAYNALAVTNGGDYAKLRKILEKYSTWSNALNATQELFPKTNSIDEWNKMKKEGIDLIMQSDQEYPAILKEIAQPPHGLYVKGNLADNHLTHVAIVGTRRCTANGRNIAYRFGQAVAKAVIVSGLALGIDTAAHEGALAAGQKTIAVLAGGLNNIYPAQNQKLADKIIASGGALISEYPYNSGIHLGRFLARNRIDSPSPHRDTFSSSP